MLIFHCAAPRYAMPIRRLFADGAYRHVDIFLLPECECPLILPPCVRAMQDAIYAARYTAHAMLVMRAPCYRDDCLRAACFARALPDDVSFRSSC